MRQGLILLKTSFSKTFLLCDLLVALPLVALFCLTLSSAIMQAECSETKQILSAVLVVAAIQCASSIFRALSASSTWPTYSLFVRAVGLMSAAVMFTLEKPLSFDILSKLFLISCTLCEVLDLWDIARALSMWPIYGPSMVIILVFLQMVSCFITLINKLHHFSIDISTVFFLAFIIIQHIIIFCFNIRIIRIFDRRYRKLSNDSWVFCLYKASSATVVTVSAAVTLILHICRLRTCVLISTLLLAIAIATLPLPSKSRPFNSLSQSLTSSSSNRDSIRTPAPNDTEAQNHCDSFSQNKPAVQEQQCTSPSLSDVQKPTETALQELPAFEHLLIELQAADKAIGDAQETFRALPKPTEQSSAASTSLQDMINPLETLKREHCVLKAFEVYARILLRNVRLLEESAPHDAPTTILAHLRQTSETLKDQMLSHSSDFMQVHPPILRDDFQITMSSCTGWLMMFITIVDGFQSKFIPGISLALEETHLSLEGYLSTVTETINQLSNVAPLTISSEGIKTPIESD